MPAVLLEDGVIDAQPFAAGNEALRRLPMRQAGAIQVGGRAALQIVGVDEIVIVAQERFDDGECWLRQSSTSEFDDVVQQVRNGFFVLRLHDLLHNGRQSTASLEENYAPDS